MNVATVNARTDNRRDRGDAPPAGLGRLRGLAIVLVVAPAALGALARSAHAQSCASDCNGNGRVEVGELVTAINVALRAADRDRCLAADMDRDGSVSIEELVGGVARSLSGCFLSTGAEAVEDATRVEDTTRSTLPKLVSLSFGGIAAGGGGGSSLRVARTRPGGALDGDGALAGGGSGRPVPELCVRGDGNSGTRFRSCDETNTLTTTYVQCRFAGEDVIRNGIERRSAVVPNDPGFNLCDRPDVPLPANAIVTVALEGYSEIAPAGGIRLANVTQTFAPALGPPCVADGQSFTSGVLTTDGLLHTFCDPDRDAACDRNLAEVRLTAHDLELRMAYAQPGICDLTLEVDGRLFVDNVSSGESFAETFLGLTLTEAVVGDRRIVSQDGRVVVDCLGEVEYATKEALSIESGALCARSGEFAIVIRESTSAASSPALARAATAEGGAALATEPNSPSVSGSLHDLAYRAANGQVYQVLQNPEGDRELQSESVQITTVVGSADGINECSTISRNATQAQAVVSAVPGFVHPIDRTFVSTVFESAAPPCFNPNGAGGDGLLCFGDCTSADCRCLRPGFCLDFSLGETADGGPNPALLPLAESNARGRLVGALAPLDPPCSGAGGRSTFGFGTDSPTVDPGLCTTRPLDGFTLRPRQSVVFAYDVPPTSGFIAGAAGFPIDEGGDSERCRAANAVVTGVATRNELGRARVTFRNGRVDFDVNDDRISERSFASCRLLSAASCAAPPPPPSPTPNRPCPEFTSGLQPQGTTAAPALNAVGGASCGDGGNRSPERTYLFRAPADGCYRIHTSGSSFDTLLYARRGETCDGPEVACNDNAEAASLDSEIFVRFERGNLERGDTAVIVVDGNSGASGNFRLAAEPVPVGNCDRMGPTRGPAYVAGLPNGGTCNVTGSPCMTGGATVTCSGLSPSSFEDLFFGLRNDQFVLGETLSGTSGPTPSSPAVFRHSGGAGTVITYLGAENPAATTIFKASAPVGPQNVATRLLLTLTSGSATIVTTGGVPADNANGDIGSLFRLTSSSFSVRVDLQASSPSFPAFGNSCPSVFDPTHTRAGVDQEISHVDLGFYWREAQRSGRSAAAVESERCDTGGSQACRRVTGAADGAAGAGSAHTSSASGENPGLARASAAARLDATPTPPGPRSSHTPTETPTPSATALRRSGPAIAGRH